MTKRKKLTMLTWITLSGAMTILLYVVLRIQNIVSPVSESFKRITSRG